MTVSLIKLSNGTELLGEVNTSEETKRKGQVRITDPFQINYKFVNYQPMPTMGISRYMPFADDPSFTFDLGDIVHIVQPRASVVDYYYYALNNCRTKIDHYIDSELQEICNRKTNQTIDDEYSDILARVEASGPLN